MPAMVETPKTAVAYVGSSLAGEIPQRLFSPEVLVLPPIRRGDLGALAPSIKSILVIDGVFHAALAVSAREILDALKLGLKVYGSSSMGVLRAAELDSYGMIGVGKVYEMYKSGEAQSDAEVALIFSEHDAIPLSEPLVNIRYAVAIAIEEGHVQAAVGGKIIAIAQSFPYYELTYVALFERLVAELTAADADSYRRFVEANRSRLDLKRLDALALAALFRAHHASDAGATIADAFPC